MVTARTKPTEDFTLMPAEIGIVGVSETSFEAEGPAQPTSIVIRTSIGVAHPKTGQIAPLAFLFTKPEMLDWLIRSLAKGRADIWGPPS